MRAHLSLTLGRRRLSEYVFRLDSRSSGSLRCRLRVRLVSNRPTFTLAVVASWFNKLNVGLHTRSFASSVLVAQMIHSILLQTGEADEFYRLKLVSWCFEPSQPQRMTSGLKTNFSLSPSYSLNKL